jgi:Ca2+-transporting ATPase
MNIKTFVSAFERKANEVANDYRVIGYAIKNASVVGTLLEEIESSLTFIGFAGMIDPPNEAKGSFSMHTSRNHPCNDYR